MCPRVDLQTQLVDVIPIWQFNVHEYEGLISLGHINTTERQAFHLFLSLSVVVYCINFHALFSPVLWLIVRFRFLCSLLCDPGFCFCFVRLTNILMPSGLLYHMCCILIRMLDKLHGEKHSFTTFETSLDTVERVGVLMASILV